MAVGDGDGWGLSETGALPHRPRMAVGRSPTQLQLGLVPNHPVKTSDFSPRSALDLD